MRTKHDRQVEDPKSYRLGAKAIIVRDGQVLLVGYDDETGLHYNFPGGGINGDESIRDGLRREILEETCAHATVGDLILAAEYFPPAHNGRYGPAPALNLFFRAKLVPGEIARMPDCPDPYQVEVGWYPLGNLPEALLPQFYERLVQQAAQADIFTTEP